MNERKPCPNCGHIGAWLCQSQLGKGLLEPKYFLECKACHWCSPKAYTVRGAIKKWNRRAKDED